MSFSPVQCGPRGAAGSVLALGLIDAEAAGQKFRTSIGVVKSVDAYGNPPTVELVDGRRMMYDEGSTYTAGDKVRVIENGFAPYVDGHMTSTPIAPVTPTDDWFYTTATTGAGGTDADRPPIGLRIWQGIADSAGKGEVSTGFNPPDVLIAVATSPEKTSGSQQRQRNAEIHPDGMAKVSGMRPGRPWKLFVVAQNNDAVSPGDYEYVCSGNNANNEDVNGGKHPRLAVATKAGSLSSTGTRSAGSLPAGVTAGRTVAVHARAIVNGISIDVSRFSSDNSEDPSTPSVLPDGTIDASHSDWKHVRSADYVMTWVHMPATGEFTATGNDHNPSSGFIGRDAIGEFPQLEFRLLDFGAFAPGDIPEPWSSGAHYERTHVAGAIGKIGAVFAVESTNENVPLLAEFHSEYADEWKIGNPRVGGYLSATSVHPLGLAVVLRGMDTAAPVALTGFTQPPANDLASVAAVATEGDIYDSSSWSLAMPAHSTGQLLVAVVDTFGGSFGQDVTIPEGWSRLLAQDNGGFSPNLFVFTKSAESGSEAPTVSITGTNTGYEKTSVVLAIDNAVSATVSAVNAYDTAVTSVGFPTGVSTKELYLHVCAAAGSQASPGLPDGDTAVADTSADGGPRSMRVSSNASSAAVTGHTVASGSWSTVTLSVG